MALYIVTYDLRDHAQSSDYKELHDVIKSFGDWNHVMYSVWIVNTTWTAEAMSEHVRAVYKPENHFVWRLTPSDHQGWLPKDDWEWINARLT